jgi:DNA-binding transcriptional LysR family regulator
VQGELSSLRFPACPDLLTPVLADFQREPPAVIVRFLTDMRLFRLDYGEAHVAMRAGAAPEEPDNVVQPLSTLPNRSLYAAKSYAEAAWPAGTEADLPRHRFVGA